MDKIKEKKCRFCKKSGIPLMKSCKPKNIQYYSCKKCQKIRFLKWYHKGENYKKQQKYNKKYEAKLKIN